MRLLKKISCLLLFVFAASFVQAQPCADNIDFKENSFKHWDCKTGSVDRSGVITFDGFVPVDGRQSLIPNTSTDLDPFGRFPVVSPNGSKYTLRLGNAGANHEAEQVSYTYTIPADQPNYTITYYYAVVLQLTNHLDFERPRFSVKLTDITNKNKEESIACGTHDFVSGDGLGDFQQATNAQVEYRDWSTVAVNLAGRAGHTIRFDFTTNDCVYNVHFGYAYLAFDDPCQKTEPISGSAFCRGANKVTLTAPPGFGQYAWHLDGQSQVLQTGQQYEITPVPPDGTKYVVDVVSLSGIGQNCPASFKAVIRKVDEDFIFNVKRSVVGCESPGIDLTDPSITAGSSADITFKYYVDANAQVVVRDPTRVTVPGTYTYYIQGTNPSGCTDIQPIEVTILPTPAVTAVIPKSVCVPATIDLTDPAIVGGNNPTLKYEYFSDAAMTIPQTNPDKIKTSGLYYIKITNNNGCSGQVPVLLTILDIPVVKPKVVYGCAPFNLASSIDKTGDTPGLNYTYYTDAAASIPVKDPDKITSSGTYYVVGANSLGCTANSPSPVQVTIYPLAALTVTQPAQVVYPATVNLSQTFTPVAGYIYSYYTDSLGTIQLTNYSAVANTGTYYIKAIINNTGCQIIKAVTATINPPDNAGLDAKNSFSPNGDNVNDEFTPKLVGAPRVNYLKIYNRNGSLVFETKDIDIHWRGTMNNSPVPVGTYYWVFSCYDVFYKQDVVKSGSVTVIR